MSFPETIPTNFPLYITAKRRMSRRLILLAASVIVASGSIVISGVVMTFLALIVSGFLFLAKTRTTRALSVIIPSGFSSLVVTIMQPHSRLSISSATLLAGVFSSAVTAGLLITSLT